MNTHEQIKELLSAYCDGAVTSQEQQRVDEHLSQCAGCRAEFEALRKVSSVLKHWKDEAVSPDLEQKIYKRLLAGSQGQGGIHMKTEKNFEGPGRIWNFEASRGALVVLTICFVGTLMWTKGWMQKGLQGKFGYGTAALTRQSSEREATDAMERSTQKFSTDIGDVAASKGAANFTQSLAGAGADSREGVKFGSSDSVDPVKQVTSSYGEKVVLNKFYGSDSSVSNSLGHLQVSNGMAQSMTRGEAFQNRASTTALNSGNSLYSVPAQGRIYPVVPSPRYNRPYIPNLPYSAYFQNYGENSFVDTKHDHLSTFAIDTDTASYTIARQYIQRGMLPPPESVRVEEFVNYFDYRYAAPESETFAVYAEGAPSDFSRKDTHILRIGVKGKEIHDFVRKPALLTFVVDVSGSMDMENRLGLIKQSLRILVDKLEAQDKVAIVAYSDNAWVEIAHTSVDNKNEIIYAIERLHTVGSTSVEQGLRLGYQLASSAFKQGYINRVILCSDGVANNGVVQAEAILEQVKQFTDRGIVVTAIGVGMENYNDVLLEKIGDKGNGKYIHLDSLEEARKVFTNDLTGELQFIAKDVKIQVDFNQNVVQSYRLLGYENRNVKDSQFRNDRVDGGEIGAGHSTTALYELKLNGVRPEQVIATVYIRYKDIDTSEVKEFSAEITARQLTGSFSQTSASFKLSAAVAVFAEALRFSGWLQDRYADYNKALRLVQEIQSNYEGDQKVGELLGLMRQAQYRLTRYHQPHIDRGYQEDHRIY